MQSSSENDTLPPPFQHNTCLATMLHKYYVGKLTLRLVARQIWSLPKPLRVLVAHSNRLKEFRFLR